MATEPATNADLDRLRREMEARMTRMEQAASRPRAADPNVARLTRAVEQLAAKVTALEAKVDNNARQFKPRVVRWGDAELDGLVRSLSSTNRILTRHSEQIERLENERP